VVTSHFLFTFIFVLGMAITNSMPNAMLQLLAPISAPLALPASATIPTHTLAPTSQPAGVFSFARTKWNNTCTMLSQPSEAIDGVPAEDSDKMDADESNTFNKPKALSTGKAVLEN
jgi:hypothetical protein